jgi:hypothetical protein
MMLKYKVPIDYSGAGTIMRLEVSGTLRKK